LWRPQPRPLSGPDADGLLDTSLPARWRGLGMSSPEAMPDRRVQARLSVDQGFPAAPADPARDAPLSQALPGRRRRRARVRPSQGRLGACSAARPWTGSGQAARRPDDPRRARLRAQPNATSTGRGVAAPQNTGPAVDPVCLKGALPRRAGARVGVVPLSGRDCWPQGQLQQILLL
jgi:hypothetical protein